MLGDAAIGGNPYKIQGNQSAPAQGGSEVSGVEPNKGSSSSKTDWSVYSKGNQEAHPTNNSQVLEDQLQKLAYYNAMNMVAGHMLEKSASKKSSGSSSISSGEMST
jgi:hypothetical protein